MATGNNQISKVGLDNLQYGEVVTASGRISATRTSRYTPDLPPFSIKDRIALDEALLRGTRVGRASFAVFFGNIKDSEIELILNKTLEPRKAVLILVEPNEKKIQIAHGVEISHRLSDPVAKLGISSIKTGIKSNDLITGIINAIDSISKAI